MIIAGSPTRRLRLAYCIRGRLRWPHLSCAWRSTPTLVSRGPVRNSESLHFGYQGGPRQPELGGRSTWSADYPVGFTKCRGDMSTLGISQRLDARRIGGHGYTN